MAHIGTHENLHSHPDFLDIHGLSQLKSHQFRHNFIDTSNQHTVKVPVCDH